MIAPLQPSLGTELPHPLPADWATVEMLGQYAYCPRRFHLIYGEGNGDDSSNRYRPGESGPGTIRSLTLASEELGLAGKMDLLAEASVDGVAVPVMTKPGLVPDQASRTYLPERIQLMARGLLLRRHGYRCDHGEVLYTASGSRIRVEFDDGLEGQTLKVIRMVRAGRGETRLPAPLDDSPKCWGCSVSGICLPDETRRLRVALDGEEPSAHPDPRRLFPAREIATPFYVQEQGARVGKTGHRLVVMKGGTVLGETRLRDTSQVVLFGNVQISTPALHWLMDEGKPVVHFSTGGWFLGMSHGNGVENALTRSAQYAAAADPVSSGRFAVSLVRAKVVNQRGLLQRHGRGETSAQAVEALGQMLRKMDPSAAWTAEQVLSWEEQAAALYFGAFRSLLKPSDFPDFDVRRRNQRPPHDPLNALLSFASALLVKECLVALWSEGLDPWWGLFHRPRQGHPALALDLMEPFRPMLVDSTVMTAINTGALKSRNFERTVRGCALKPTARKALLKVWEQRLDQLLTHPDFGYRCSWRTVLRLQARLLARLLRGDITNLPWPVER